MGNYLFICDFFKRRGMVYLFIATIMDIFVLRGGFSIFVDKNE